MMTKVFWGWRRKVGMLTLLLSCAVTGGWVRGLSDVDMLFYRSDRQTMQVIYSSPSGIGWTALHDVTPTRILGGLPIGMFSLESMHAAGHSNGIYPFDWLHTSWSSQWFGFYAGTIYLESLPPSPRSVGERRTWIVRYPSVVIPLTLISLCLLLTQPRKSTHQKIVALTANEGH